MIRRGEGPFSVGAIGGAWYRIETDVQAALPIDAPKVYRAAIMHALKEAGWRDLGRLHSAAHSTKKQVWASPTLANVSKSAIRDMIEPGATVVAMKKAPAG